MNAWHQRYRTWQGTVEDMAAEVDGLMSRLGMPPGTSSAPNVRLIRHYLTVGALTRPVRSSRNAIFEGRAVLEVVAIRHLLGQGWPLQKIAELLPTLDWDQLVQLLPEPVARPGPTPPPRRWCGGSRRHSPGGRSARPRGRSP
jgi:hypothetical protein